jgi:hypothetical protein
VKNDGKGNFKITIRDAKKKERQEKMAMWTTKTANVAKETTKRLIERQAKVNFIKD